MRACPSELSLANGISTPIRRICPDCCARKVSGQATAEPPTSVMKSRRLMERPLRADDCSLSHCPTLKAMLCGPVMWSQRSAAGQKATLQGDRRMSAIQPKIGHHRFMSTRPGLPRAWSAHLLWHCVLSHSVFSFLCGLEFAARAMRPISPASRPIYRASIAG